MPTTTTSNVRQLSDGSPQGTAMGQSATDLIAFYTSTAAGTGATGAQPVVQPSGGQAAITRGVANGAIMTFASAQSPASSGTLTTSEKSFTVQNGTSGTLTPASGDTLLVNKPTAQAGLGVGNVRFSAAGVAGVTFNNFSAGTLTPTATEDYGVIGIRGFTITSVLTPAAVAASTTAEQLFTVTGAVAGMHVVGNKPTSQAGLDIVNFRVAAANSVGITFANLTAAALTPTAAETYSFVVTNGIDSVDNQITLALNSTLTPSTVTAANVANITLSSSNIRADDTFIGVQKPTNQVTVAVVGGFVSAAGVIKVAAINPTLTVSTPTASEIYGVTLTRVTPAAPCIVYSPVLTPTSVAANTTAEQTFAVAGVVAGSAVSVNYMGVLPAGLGIVGTRVSSAGNIGITFCNATATTITPSAATYSVANWQALIDVTTGNAMIVAASPSDSARSVLTNAMRSALGPTGVNLIAGT